MISAKESLYNEAIRKKKDGLYKFAIDELNKQIKRLSIKLENFPSFTIEEAFKSLMNYFDFYLAQIIMYKPITLKELNKLKEKSNQCLYCQYHLRGD